MHIQLSSDLIEELKKRKQKDKQLIVKVEKQLALFAANPKHPSLRTHKLTGNLDQRFSISVDKSIRMVYIILERDSAYFIALGTHDQIYKK